jgi:hypothetical protein
MHGPITTAGKIDAFETRFTIVNGAHFLIAPNGKEAWPISAAEADAFKALYRRRLVRARWIRRGLLFGPALLMVLAMMSAAIPDGLGIILLPLYLLAIPLAFLQHALTADLTRWWIERQLQRRITTRLPEATTPPLTPIGRLGKRLLIGCIALEIGMVVLHLLLGMDALAEHMRVLYGQTNGDEGMLAQFTGNLAWFTQFALMLAILLMIVDRRIRRGREAAAKLADARAAAAKARERVLQRLAAQDDGTPLAES